MIEIPYSEDRFDQWRLSKAGGMIGIKPNGVPVFQFPTREQFDLYNALNAERSERVGSF